MTRPLRVGLIGANAESGWARDGHVPALQSLDGIELVAVATNRRETADAAARAFGVPEAFASGLELVRAADVDLVAVTVRVPDHRELVLAALAAGKHVYCEWPLGRGVAEAEEMAVAARAAGVHTAIGLQLRESPTVHAALEVVRGGRLGRLLAVRTASATAGFGPVVPEPFLYLEDPAAFANLVTIQGAHTLDLALALFGGLGDASALATTQFPEIAAGTNGEPRPRVTADHLLVQGRFAGGGVLGLAVAGGRPPETPFHLEAVHEHGVLTLGGGAARGFQSGRITMSVDGEAVRVDEGEIAPIPDAAANVAGVYARLRDDIATGSRTVTGFDHAARLTKLLVDLLASSASGSRATAAGWPA